MPKNRSEFFELFCCTILDMYGVRVSIYSSIVDIEPIPVPSSIRLLLKLGDIEPAGGLATAPSGSARDYKRKNKKKSNFKKM